MARIRTIKPQFWEDEKIAKLPRPCRLFYIGTWSLADDMGVIRGNATLLKSAIFPYDEDLRVAEVQKWIDALVDARMLIPITYKNESYYIIRTFRNHQKFDPRYKNNIIPENIISCEIEKYENGNIDTTSTQRGPNGDPMGTQRDHDETTPREGEWEGEYNNPHNPPKGENTVNFSFEEFWDLYDKKVGKKDNLIKKWLKLSDKERELAMSYIPKYKLSQPDKKYRKNPETFLNQKSWNDELIFQSPKINFADHDNERQYTKF